MGKNSKGKQLHPEDGLTEDGLGNEGSLKRKGLDSHDDITSKRRKVTDEAEEDEEGDNEDVDQEDGEDDGEDEDEMEAGDEEEMLGAATVEDSAVHGGAGDDYGAGSLAAGIPEPTLGSAMEGYDGDLVGKKRGPRGMPRPKLTEVSEPLGAAGMGRRRRRFDGDGPVLSAETDVTQMWITSKQLRQLADQGVVWKTGKWTNKETQSLQENIQSYLRENNLGENIDVLLSKSGEHRDFWRRAARGLGRPLFNVYRHVMRTYDANNNRGRYTPEEDERLRQLVASTGHDWKQIGLKMNRSAGSCRDRWRQMAGDKKGAWTQEEIEKLSAAVHALTGTKIGERVDAHVPWVAVAEMVGTRSERQCRVKWYEDVNLKESVNPNTQWTETDTRKMLDVLYNSGAEDESEIVWKNLFQGWAWSPLYISRKWSHLVKLMSGREALTFEQKLDYLRSVQTRYPDLADDEDVSNPPGVVDQDPKQ